VVLCRHDGRAVPSGRMAFMRWAERFTLQGSPIRRFGG
jgi:hypothetical protein